MAPPELGSQSEDSQSESNPLEYIEQTLRRLEKNTIEMRKKNDEIIRTINRPSTTSSSLGWKGAPIDVPFVPLTMQIKPPRTSSSRASLNIGVEKILQESSKLKNKIHETLRLSLEDREQNTKYLDELRQQSHELSSVPLSSVDKFLLPIPIVPLALSTNNMCNGGILSSLKNVLKKLNPTDSGDKFAKRGEHKENALPINSSCGKNNGPEREIPVELLPLSFNDAASTLPPPIKPRIKRQIKGTELSPLHPTPRPRIHRPHMPPPPPPPPLPSPLPSQIRQTIQLQDLRKLYQNQSVTSDEEAASTFPTPKPRTSTLQRQESSQSSESTSEFEYIETPLLFQTVALAESDDSLILHKNVEMVKFPEPDKHIRFQKNLQSKPQIPRQYKRQIEDESVMEETNYDTFPAAQQIIQKSKHKIRLSSPPPAPLSMTKLASGTALAQTHLSEEESLTNSTDDESLIPVVLHCLPSMEKAVLCNYTSSPELTRTSALQFGVPVNSIEVPVLPWTTDAPPTNYKILTSPFHLSEIVMPVLDELKSEEIPIIPISGDIEEINMDQKIHDEFSFLDEVVSNENSSKPCIATYFDNIVEGTQQINEDGSHNVTKQSCCYHQTIETVTDSEMVYANTASTSRICQSFENREEIFNLESTTSPILNRCQLQTEDLSTSLSPPPPFVPPPPPPMPSNFNIQTSFSTFPVIPLDEWRYKETIFHTLDPIAADQLQLDAEFLEENFLNSESPKNDRRRSIIMNCTRDSRDPIMFLSLKLKQAIEIGARRIQQSQPIISYAIKTLNPKEMNTEDVQVLLQMLPKDANERLAFFNLNDQQCKTLPEGYKIMKCLVEIPRLSQKLQALNFLLNFDDAIMCVESQTNILQTAIQSVKNSKNFGNILRVVLTVVNQLAQNGKEVKGFQIQSMERLAKKKSCKGGMSLLNYIVKRVGESIPEALNFADDFKYVEEASKISLNEVRKVLNDLGEEAKGVEGEILTTQKDCGDEEILTSLSNSLSSIQAITLKHKETFEHWESTVKQLKEMVGFFGMFNTPDEELVEFFHVIDHFVKDFKHALVTNIKLFAPAIEFEKASADSKMEKSMLILNTHAGSADKSTKISRNRTSANFSQTNAYVEENNGQSQELVDAITKAATASKDLRRSPLRDGGDEGSTENIPRRRRNRNSQNFVVIAENNRERK